MAYIGKQPVVGNFQVCDAISVVNGQAAYTMQVESTNVEPENANHMLVSLNGVLQKPGSSFTISGATITFASNLATGDVIDFIILLGDTLNVGTPSDNTVSTAKIVDGAVTSAKMFSGFANGITMADQWRITANTSVRASEFLTANWERVDTTSAGFIGTGVTESSGVFTFPSTGIYLITATIQNETNGSRTYSGGSIHVTTDNSTYSIASEQFQSTDSGKYVTVYPSFILDVTDTSNIKIKLKFTSSGSDKTIGNTSEFKTGVSFIRLGDT